MQQDAIIGWDIGGAHVKTAVIDARGVVKQVLLQPCPLWQGLAQLQKAVALILASLHVKQAQHVLTMTGELVDCFDNREQGVRQILAEMVQLLPAQMLYVFAGAKGFIAVEQVSQQHLVAIASANWLATAGFVAMQQTQGVLIDIGSTTTDILVFQDKMVQAQGYTDYQRLITGELVYTGIVRTAVMAVAQQAFFNGQLQGLMAEYFATMADVYRVTGELQEAHDHTATADGAEKTMLASARRLSRLTGYDFKPEEMAIWQLFAANLREQQLQMIAAGLNRQLAHNKVPVSGYFIGAGVGRFLVRALAQQFDYPYRDFDDLITAALPQHNLSAADCAPAVAVALLFSEEQAG